jgi:hypothetical protein
MSRISDPSANRVWSISFNALRSTLSKKDLNVGLQNPTHLATANYPIQGSNGVVGATPRPESVRTVQEVLLVNRLQNLADDVLDQFVLERRYPNRPRLAPSLRDVDASDRLVAVAFGPQPLVQVFQTNVQILPVPLLRHPVHTHRRVLAAPGVGPPQRRHIDQMRQRVEPSLGLSSRSFRYPQKSR